MPKPDGIFSFASRDPTRLSTPPAIWIGLDRGRNRSRAHGPSPVRLLFRGFSYLLFADGIIAARKPNSIEFHEQGRFSVVCGGWKGGSICHRCQLLTGVPWHAIMISRGFCPLGDYSTADTTTAH